MNPGDFGSGSQCQYQASACGQCWSLTGPGGTARIQVTDCCAGYAGKPSCLSSTDPYCDWCAANDHQHFDLDWNSFATVCGGEVDQGHCVISSAVNIPCPSSAVADTSNPTFAGTSAASNSAPSWAIGLFVVGSLTTVALLIIVVLLFRFKKTPERA